MRVLIVGDVHGQHRPLAEILRRVQSDFGINAAIQVGDFGFDRALMTRLREDRIRFPVPLHVIDGNHEDHAWLHRALLTNATHQWREEANLIYQPRPSIARFGAATAGFLGGALHVDRPQQHNLSSRLPNYILSQHRRQAATLFNRERPDLIVTHSCPAGIGIGMHGATELTHSMAEHVITAGHDPGPPDDCGEAELARLWRELTPRPGSWVFGHFHRMHNVRVNGTRFVCVGNDLALLEHTLVLWDTEEKEVLTVKY